MLQKALGAIVRLSDAYALYTALIGSAAAGLIVGWAASTVATLAPYGALAIVAAGLLGSLTVALIVLVAAYARNQFTLAKFYKKWVRDVDAVNPLEPEFRQKRLRIAELAHPTTLLVEKKRFIDCELIGPATVFIALPSTFINVVFDASCPCMVVYADQDANMFNPGRVIVLRDVELINCRISQINVMLAPQEVENFMRLGARFITLTGNSAIDGPKLEANAARRAAAQQK